MVKIINDTGQNPKAYIKQKIDAMDANNWKIPPAPPEKEILLSSLPIEEIALKLKDVEKHNGLVTIASHYGLKPEHLEEIRQYLLSVIAEANKSSEV